MNKILVICAHPDDEVLGCGGTLLKHKNNKDQINILFVFEGSSARYKNIKNLGVNNDMNKREKSAIQVSKKLKAKSIKFLNYQNLITNADTKLKITKQIFSEIKKINPQIIYTHSSKDLNIDHRLCLESVLIATRPDKELSLKKLLCFEIPSSTEWSHNIFGNFSPNYFVNIEKFMKDKLELLKLYNYELKQFPYPRSNENIIAQSKLAGSLCGCKHAERFEVIKILE
tara:strand:- start:53 stop:736 length:684 start_codon:yes stop_codon:yes gene_type:complete